MMDALPAILIATLVAGTPLVYAALGELVVEKSGVLNLGVEGMMLTGAIAAFATAHATGNLWLGVAVGCVAGIVKAWPLRMSNFAPCRGQAIVKPSSVPSLSGPPSWVQTSSMAKNRPPTWNSAITRSSSSTSFRPGSGISLTLATRTN